MILSVRAFGKLVGASTVSDMARKVGLVQYRAPCQCVSSFSISAVHYDTLHLSRIDPLTLRSGEHPRDSHSVPPKIKGGIDLDVTDPGKGSQRRATS